MFFLTKYFFFCLSVNCFTTKPRAGLKQCINRFVFAAGLQQGLQQLSRAPLCHNPPEFNYVWVFPALLLRQEFFLKTDGGYPKDVFCLYFVFCES